jgi:hypothetical protein
MRIEHRLAALALIFGAVVLAGCSSAAGTAPWTSAAFSPRAECERNAGAWLTALNYCEIPGKQ